MAESRRRVLNGRYAIDDVLGQGGMAKVFRGTDKVLGRTIAVKVLSPQFADDEAFVARFRREAQAAAALNHPNIVGVFDTGSQNGVHYIVMEYVEGRTLRDVIRADAPLLPQRALEITDAVAQALGSAHEAGLVHRDIKPGNIMLTQAGEVKVMDFGIARTTTGDTLTQTAAILGTALYLSPEQAQGETVDGRSDIYSLGCALYEMLTAQPPFTGDSPVSIAYKHVRDTPPLPSQLNPDVPAAVDAIVMKMLAKNAANRYQSAAELSEDLARVAGGHAPLATPILPGATTEVFSHGSPSETAVLTQAPRVEPMPPEGEERRKIWPWILGILFLVALGVAAFFLIRSLQGGPQVTIPDVRGMEEQAAVAELERVGLDPEVEERFHDTVPRGEVITTEPPPRTEVDEGSQVVVLVSRGARPVGVPNVVGETQEEATNILQDAGFEVGVSEQESEVPEGQVIAQDPEAGERARPGDTVTITVSTGPPAVEVPGVICASIGDAQARLAEAGLESNVAPGQRSNEDCEPGTVAQQSPAAGATVEQGTVVTLFPTRAEPSPSPSPTESPTESPSP